MQWKQKNWTIDQNWTMQSYDLCKASHTSVFSIHNNVFYSSNGGIYPKFVLQNMDVFQFSNHVIYPGFLTAKHGGHDLYRILIL